MLYILYYVRAVYSYTNRIYETFDMNVYYEWNVYVYVNMYEEISI